MIVVFDIGNTNISLGLFKGKNLVRAFEIPAKNYSWMRLEKLLSGITLYDAVVSSVVPSLTHKLSADLKRIIGTCPYILGKNIKVPMKSLYRFPDKLGNDRLINAYAASLLYGAPVIVIDFGTAVTFDVVSRKGEYLGGMIFPGLGLSLDALRRGTSLLPSLKPAKPKEFIGRDTVSGMQSGIVNGYAAMADCLCARIKEKIGRGAHVVATGGSIRLLEPYCRSIDRISENLTLEGLNLVYYNTVSGELKKA